MTVISLTGLFLACPTGGGGSSGSVTPPPVNKTPSSNQYEIVGTRTVDFGTALNITVRKKAGVDASEGAISAPVYTNSDSETTAYNSATPPTAIGLYDVKVDIEAATGWDEAKGLYVGSVSIRNTNKLNLVLADFDLSDFPNGIAEQSITDPQRPVVRVAASVTGVTNADITTYYAGSTTFPTGEGTYDVTFNVNTTDKYNPIAGLSAGLLRLTDPSTPTTVTMVGPEDFNVKINDVLQQESAASQTGFSVEFINEPLIVTLTNRTGKAYPINSDNVDIKYWTAANVMIAEPKDVGVYTVAVKLEPIVQQGATWNGPSFSFTMAITKRTPVAGDFDVGNKVQSAAGSFLSQNIVVKDVTIAFIDKYLVPDSTTGLDIAIYYDGVLSGLDGDGNTTIPQNAGEYAVTFDIVHHDPDNPTNTNWVVPTRSLSGGTLTVKALQPVIPQIGTKLWIDDDAGVMSTNVPKTDSGKYQLGVNPGQSVEFMFENKQSYTVVGWYEDGNKVENTGYTYTFRKYATGWHTVTLVVQGPGTPASGSTPAKPGKAYSETVEIRVQTN